MTDPRLLDPDLPVMPKLELLTDDWIERVADLIESAAFVALELFEGSPGVAAELSLIRKLEKQATTVIVIASQEDDRALESYWRVQRLEHPTYTVESPELHDFPRIVEHTDLAYDALEESPTFAGLLPAAS